MFKITIQEIITKTEPAQEYKIVDKVPVPEWNGERPHVQSDGSYQMKEVYGYVDTTKEKITETKVYEQLVEQIDLPAVVAVINQIDMDGE